MVMQYLIFQIICLLSRVITTIFCLNKVPHLQNWICFVITRKNRLLWLTRARFEPATSSNSPVLRFSAIAGIGYHHRSFSSTSYASPLHLLTCIILRLILHRPPFCFFCYFTPTQMFFQFYRFNRSDTDLWQYLVRLIRWWVSIFGVFSNI